MLTPDDFKHALSGVPEDEIERVIRNVLAIAARHAPAIKTDAFKADTDKVDALKAILEKAVLYEVRSANGTIQTESAGQFSHTINTQMPQSSLYFSPQQVEELKRLGAIPIAHGFYSIPLTTVENDGVW